MMLIISKFLGLALRPRGTRLRTAKILKFKKTKKNSNPTIIIFSILISDREYTCCQQIEIPKKKMLLSKSSLRQTHNRSIDYH